MLQNFEEASASFKKLSIFFASTWGDEFANVVLVLKASRAVRENFVKNHTLRIFFSSSIYVSKSILNV